MSSNSVRYNDDLNPFIRSYDIKSLQSVLYSVVEGKTEEAYVIVRNSRNYPTGKKFHFFRKSWQHFIKGLEGSYLSAKKKGSEIKKKEQLLQQWRENFLEKELIIPNDKLLSCTGYMFKGLSTLVILWKICFLQAISQS